MGMEKRCSTQLHLGKVQGECSWCRLAGVWMGGACMRWESNGWCLVSQCGLASSFAQ